MSLISSSRPILRCIPRCIRQYTVLAIESSCDDTSVAVLSHTPSETELQFHDTITSDNRKYGGVHPLTSIESHRRHIAPLLSRAIKTLNGTPPDLVAATRGPGMRSCLSIGMDAAYGVCAAFDRPFIGVHHMQAHMLTPRLIHAMEKKDGDGKSALSPEFPFLTLLVSGGHTMLLESTALDSHSLIAESIDIAVGDYIDKAARDILPPDILAGEPTIEGEPHKHVAYGKLLEDYAFPKGRQDYNYLPPKTAERIRIDNITPGYFSRWNLGLPLLEKGAKSTKRMAFSFSGIGAQIVRLAPYVETNWEKRELAAVSLTVAFEHITSRIIRALEVMGPEKALKMQALVVSGGVASNSYLRHLMRMSLDAEGYEGLQLLFPPPRLCTDNAAMIAWAAAEMYDAGWTTEWGVEPVAKWSLDPKVNGGIMGLEGWKRVIE